MRRINLTETERIETPRGITILNLGCGDDWYGTHRADFEEKENVNNICNLEEPLPFEDNSFNEIRLWRVLEHIKNIGQLIDECHRVLKPNGRIDIITDYAGYVFYYLKTDHNEWNDRVKSTEEDNHYHLFVESHLKRLLRKFIDLKVTFPQYKKDRWKRLILYYLIPFRMGFSEIRIVGKKKIFNSWRNKR